MMTYIIRRCLYAIPVLFGVNILVFLLFFFVNSPDHMARAHLGQKRVTPEQIDAWKRERLLHPAERGRDADALLRHQTCRRAWRMKRLNRCTPRRAKRN